MLKLPALWDHFFLHMHNLFLWYVIYVKCSFQCPCFISEIIKKKGSLLVTGHCRSILNMYNVCQPKTKNSENYYYLCIPAVRSAVKIEYTLDQHVQDGIHRLI